MWLTVVSLVHNTKDYDHKKILTIIMIGLGGVQCI